MQNNNSKAIKIMLESILNLIEQNNKNNTIIENCLISNINSDGTCSILKNGQTYVVEKYGNNTITINTTAKLFIPNGNMALAFIM